MCRRIQADGHPSARAVSVIGNAVGLGRDARSGLALDDIDNIGERANHRIASAMAGEIDGGLYFRPHRTGGKPYRFYRVGMRAGYRFLRFFAPIDKGGRNVGGDNEQIRFEIFGEQGGAKVFVNDCFHAVQIVLLVVIGRNAATPGANDDAAVFEQPFHRTDFEDAFWQWTWHYAAVFVAILRNRPAFLFCQLFRFCFGINRANRFGRVLEGRIISVHFHLRQ